MKPLQKTIGDRIRKRRKDLGFTQRQLADACDVEQSTYQRWEAGATRPETEALGKLARKLALPLHELMSVDQPIPELPLPSAERALEILREELEKRVALSPIQREILDAFAPIIHDEAKVAEHLKALAADLLANPPTSSTVARTKQLRKKSQ